MFRKIKITQNKNSLSLLLRHITLRHNSAENIQQIPRSVQRSQARQVLLAKFLPQ